MSPSLRTTLSTQAQSDLQHLSSLLHLAHHRNSNQHRRSIWYRTFSILRRQLRHLLADYTELSRIPDTHLGRHRKKAHDIQTTQRVRQRLEFWRDVLVPRTQRAFSQLVADHQFAVLGVFLMAVLAQVCGIVGISAEYERMGQDEIEKVLNRFAVEVWEQGGDEVGVESAKANATGEDLGEVLTREEAGTLDRSAAPSLPARPSEDVMLDAKPQPLTTTTSPTSPDEASSSLPATKVEKKSQPSKMKAQKKRKKRDAIDDLFNGL